MKNFDVSHIAVLTLFALVSLVSIPKVYAATSPSLGTADSFSILAGTEITNVPTSTIGGDVGLSPAAGSNYSGLTTGEVTGTIYAVDNAGPDGVAGNNPGLLGTALADTATAYSALASQGCDTTYAGTKELAGENLVPGVYCADSFHLTNGTLTLNGSSSGVWIFKSASDLVVTGGSSSVVFTGTGLACNVWWRVVSSASFGASSSFVGNVLADTSITFGANASLNGRALARTGNVTLISNTISGPVCTVSSDSSDSSNSSSRPEIRVDKTANPTTLPSGGGMVVYTYKVTNPGSVALHSIRISDDKCKSMTGPTGDRNNDDKLNTSETWIYTCQMKLTNTTKNIVTVRGKANGETVVDRGRAIVVVGAPGLPNTGVDPNDKNIFGQGILLLSAIVSLLLFSFSGNRLQRKAVSGTNEQGV